jgi:hypothetical protein
VLERTGDVKALVRELCEATHTDRPV